jgi:hypothetical protein
VTSSSALDLVCNLAERGGASLGQADIELLSSQDSLATVGADSRVERAMQALFLGFFDAAADGVEFVPRQRIVERFGRTLEQNYPGASLEFMGMAYSYWTLKVAHIDARETGDRSLAWQLLAELEGTIAARFFPAAGRIKIDPVLHENELRRALAAMAPRINADAFIRGNPILVRDRKASTGCIFLLIGLPALPLITWIV